MNIIQIVPEVLPFFKSYSMSETVFSLSSYLAKVGNDVTVISPLYAHVDVEKYKIISTQLKTWVDAGFTVYEFEIYELNYNNVRFVFLKNDDLFGRPGFYGDGLFDYADNDIRFGTFCQAALNFIKYHDVQADIIHSHDWQTALVPVYSKLNFSDIKCKNVHTIHSANLGIFNKFTIEALNLPWSIYNIEHLEYYDNISFLKGGIVYADAITTISPTFAAELKVDGGESGIEGIFITHFDKLSGILNGINYDLWNPSDKDLVQAYSADDISGKTKCKEAFCEQYGLDSSKPLIAFIQRLLPERGIGLILDSIADFDALGYNMAILGPMNTDYNGKIQSLKDTYKNLVAIYDDHMSASMQLYAAADIILSPSMYEPCGVSQMIGIRYGDIPVSRNIGGLKDSLKEPLEQNYAFNFDKFEKESMFIALKKAVELISDNDKRAKAISFLMKIDNSWTKPIKKYLSIYNMLLKK